MCFVTSIQSFKKEIDSEESREKKNTFQIKQDGYQKKIYHYLAVMETKNRQFLTSFDILLIKYFTSCNLAPLLLVIKCI